MKKLSTLCFLINFLSTVHAQFPQLWTLAASGGANSKGTIFNIRGDGTNLNVAYNFGTITNDGYNYWYSQCSLVHAGNGLLYGKNTEGGANGSTGFAGGIIFSYNPATNTYKDVYDFPAFTFNWGDLMLASDGKLYGMTSSGSGLHADGYIFSIDTLGNFTDLYDFETATATNINPNSIIGREPNGGLIQASNGLIYGMTAANAGDSGNYSGAIISFDPATVSNSNPPALLHVFAGGTADGNFPIWNGNLLLASDGLLYGMTSLAGVDGDGVVFCCDLNGNNYRVIYNFTGTPGGQPCGSLVQAPNGLLYGMDDNDAFVNGSYGALFSIDTNRTNANPYSTLVTFPITAQNAATNGTLLLASDGNLYGFTDGTSSGTDGVVFSYNISTRTYTPLYTLVSANGTNPNGAFLELRTLSTSTITGSPFCAGATVAVPFIATGIYTYANVFTAQLSDASGSFSNPVNIGTLAGTTSGTINATIPGGTPAGAGYRIRVVGNNPNLTGTDNGINITISICSGAPVAGFIADDTVVCSGGTVHFTDQSTGSPMAWSWTFAGGTPGSSTSPDPSVVYNTAGQYSVKLVASNLSGSDSVTTTNYITVVAMPATGTLNPPSDTICAGNPAELSANGSSGSLQWQSSLTGNNFANIANATTSGYTSPALSQTTYYRLVAVNGICADTSAAVMVLVNPNPTPPVLSASDTLICPSDSALVSASGSYSTYQWNNGDTRSFTYANAAGGYWVTVTNTYGCSAVSEHQNISVFPVLPVSITVKGDTLSSYGAVSYQWFFSGDSIPGATLPVHIAQSTGNYAVQVTDTNGCTAISNTQYVQITGIVEPAEPEVLSIYPNPSGNTVFIAVHNIGVDEVVIYDALGRAVWSAGYNNSYSNLLSIDVSSLPAGPYYISVKITGDKNYYRQMVKL